LRKASFLPAAEHELLQEVAYYSLAREGLGIRFQAAVEATVARAVVHPSSGAPSNKRTRSLVVKGFPFNVVYLPDPDEVLVVAVSHHKRKPGYWSSRLE